MSTDHNLLFGMLALQMDFVTRDQLLDAMLAWTLRKQTPLGELLHEKGVLSADDMRLIGELVDRRVRQHGDAQKSLASLRADSAARGELARIADPEVQSSVASLATTPGNADLWQTEGHPPRALEGMRYRRLRAHARGGLGEVSVALDEELRREVALKEIHSEFADNADSRRRFVREAEVTGNLEHPGVVPVYGLGSYPDGRPFYAMRFIRGESMQVAISRFHQADGARRDPGERSLALRDLLTRFLGVCDAIGYAHSCGVLHRDLKPANVMLGEFGETLVVDWGLARVLDQAGGESTMAERLVLVGSDGASPTQMGQAMGTPAYMPPEQAEGRLDRLGPAADVFALGATLYCLLTGKPPYAGQDALSLARQAEVTPARQVKRLVPPPLEAVCAKAMARVPADRYATARALADEVRLWLADEPVTAYREPLADRARRWGRRNRSVVAVGVAVLLASLTGLMLGLWAVSAEKVRTEEQRDRAILAEGAERERADEAQVNLHRATNAEATATANLKEAEANLALARKAIDECFNVAKGHPLFKQPRMETAKKLLLERTLPFYKNFRARRPDDARLRMEEADQWFHVGYIEQVLMRLNEGIAAYAKAQEALSQLVKDHPNDSRYVSSLARAHNNLGGLLLEKGQRDEALQEYSQARDWRDKLSRKHPNEPEYANQLAGTLTNIGSVLNDMGKLDEARGVFTRAAELLASLAAAHPNVAEYQQDLGGAKSNLGLLLVKQGKRTEARREYTQARQVLLALVRSRPSAVEYRADLARLHTNLGSLLRDMGESREASLELDSALKLLTDLSETHPDVPRFQSSLASVHQNLGNLMWNLGKRDEAVRQHALGQQVLARLVKANPSVPGFRSDLARCHYNLGTIYSKLDQYEKALKEYGQARELNARLVRDQPTIPQYLSDLSSTYNNLGAMLYQTGKQEEALREFLLAREMLLRLVKQNPEVPEYTANLAHSYLNLGLIYSERNRLDDALAEFDEGIRQTDSLRRQDPRHPLILQFLMFGLPHRASLLGRAGRVREADADWERALTTAPPEQRFTVRVQRAECRARAGDYSRAVSEAGALSRLPTLPAEAMYNLACVHALSSASARRDPARPLPSRDKLAEQYARAAVVLLGRAADAGHFRDGANATQMSKDADLNSLRGRDDFRAFVASLPGAKP